MIIKFLFVLSLFFSISCFSQATPVIVSIGNCYSIKSNTIELSHQHLTFAYQSNAPKVPFYSYSVEIPDKGNYKIQVTFLDSLTYDNIELPISHGLEKSKGNFNTYDTSYFIDKYSPNRFFPQKESISFSPVIARDSRIQTFHIFPFKYLSTAKELKVYTRFKIEVISLPGKGINEITNNRNYLTTQNFYSKNAPNALFPKYQPISADGDLLIVYKNTSDSLVKRFAHWKDKTGRISHLLKFTLNDSTPELIKAKINTYFDSIPDILYLLLIGDENEIPPYLYKTILNTNYYSDSYYGMLDGNDLIPELLVGRFSGTEAQNRVIINKTIAYEQYQVSDNYEQNLMLIASNQGENIGDDNETDWQHLRNIGNYLSEPDSANMQPYEYFDGSQGGLDAPGNPIAEDLQNGFNLGKGMTFYTGHGEFTSFTTGNFFTMHVRQLENYNKLPVIISAACDNGMFMDGLDCLGEVFTFVTKDNQLTGAVAFAGSSILMSWAPPMQTQDEFATLINPASTKYKETLGAAFYNAQLSMLEHYPTVYGDEVMQTWILFGDPSLKLRINQKGKIIVNHPNSVLFSTPSAFSFPVNINNAFITLSQNDSVIASSWSNNNSVSFSNIHLNPNYPIQIVGTKSNYQTYLGEIYFTNRINSESGKSFKIYPNPTKNKVQIEGESSVDKMEIFDLTGKKLDIKFDSLSKSINLDGLSSGVYQLVITNLGEKYTYKIIKE